jgi:hypothetical protein
MVIETPTSDRGKTNSQNREDIVVQSMVNGVAGWTQSTLRLLALTSESSNDQFNSRLDA